MPSQSTKSTQTWNQMEIFTFKKHNFVVPWSLINGIHTVQIGRKAPPETMDLSRAKRHQVLLSS